MSSRIQPPVGFRSIAFLTMTLSVPGFLVPAFAADPVKTTTASTEDATPAPPEERDVLTEALAAVGASRADLGTRPNPAWTRFPHPHHIPYTPPFFEGVYAEPLRLYDVARTLGNTVERYLAPGVIEGDAQALHRLVYYLGVDKRHIGFRDYSANLPEPKSTATLLDAIAATYAFDRTPVESRSFGKTTSGLLAELEGEVARIPAELQRIAGNLVYALIDASHWQRTAMRNVPEAVAAACWRAPTLGEFTGAADTYAPHVADADRGLDQAAMDYASIKTVQAVQDARRALATWLAKASAHDRKALEGLAFAHRTPLGWIVLGGTRDNTHTITDALVVIDAGGADRYSGSVGASTPRAPISVCIDMDGRDEYRTLDVPAQGAGIFGAGVLLDVAGDDLYEAGSMAQGAGFFGVGMLLDEKGMDRYVLRDSGQGCGYFGIGLCFDVQGDDDFAITGDGQGFGGVGAGVGVLADYSGRDHYIAEPYAKVAGRERKEGSGDVRVSNAQGVAKGRRADGSDGHAWAGGLGAIVDIQGNDTYESGNWSLGAGYWFGTGVAYDGAGDDLYRSVYFTQGAGAHYANGVLVDESGQDQHLLYDTAGAGFGFGWDYANALFVDKSGDDRYEAQTTSFGRADIRSTAMFFDLDGDDRYQLAKGQAGLGAADFRDTYATPDPFAPYQSETMSFGIWIDAGGLDMYNEWDANRRQAAQSATWGNDRSWMSPAPGSKEHGFANHGIGVDVSGGTVPELFRFDPAKASPTSRR